MEDGVYGYLEILYWVSQYVWKGKYFHDKCDKKGETISAIWSIDGFIFGGFSDKPWTSTVQSYKHDHYLLFSLNIPPKKFGPTNMRILQEILSNDMLQHPYCGPIIGASHKLCISRHATISSYSDIEQNYEISTIQTKMY